MQAMNDAGPDGDGAVSPFDAGVRACDGTDFSESSGTTILGFGLNPSLPGKQFTATIQEVAADKLLIRPDGGDAVEFQWTGPSLLTEFSVNEVVRVERQDSGWQMIIGTVATAAVLNGWSNTSIPLSQKVPGGPLYELEPLCASLSKGYCNDKDVFVQRFYEVNATLDGDSVLIPLGATRSLGAWTLTNVRHSDQRYVKMANPSFPGCVVDPMDYYILTALGPGSAAMEQDAGM